MKIDVQQSGAFLEIGKAPFSIYWLKILLKLSIYILLNNHCMKQPLSEHNRI